MELKFLLMIGIAVLLIGYYIYVLYYTLRKKRKYDKSSDAQELYARSNVLYWFLFGNLFKSDKGNRYKILKNNPPENQDEEAGQS